MYFIFKGSYSVSQPSGGTETFCKNPVFLKERVFHRPHSFEKRYKSTLILALFGWQFLQKLGYFLFNRRLTQINADGLSV